MYSSSAAAASSALSVHQFARFLPRQSPDLASSERLSAVGALQRRRKPVGRLARPDGHCDQDRRGRRSIQQSAEKLDRRGVGPVDVVEHEHDRAHLGEALEQCPYSAVAPVALVLDRHPPSLPERDQGREDRGQLGPDIWTKVTEAKRVDPLDVLVEGIDEQPEREIALQLSGTAREDGVATCVGTFGELGQKAGLSDSRLAHELERRGLPRVEL